MYQKYILFFFILSLYNPSFVYPATIKLKSGKIIEAEVLNKTEKYLEIDISGIKLKYYLNEIEAIDGQEIIPIPKSRQTESSIDIVKTNDKQIFEDKDKGYYLEYPLDWQKIEQNKLKQNAEIGFTPKENNFIVLYVYLGSISQDKITKDFNLKDFAQNFKVPKDFKKISENPLIFKNKEGYFVRYIKRISPSSQNNQNISKDLGISMIIYYDCYYFLPALSERNDNRLFILQLNYFNYDLIKKEKINLSKDVIDKINASYQEFNQKVEKELSKAKEIIESFIYRKPSKVILNELVTENFLADKTFIEKDKFNEIQSYINNGIIYFNNKEYQKAIDEFKKALEINPNYYEAYLNLGYVETALKHYNKAIDYFKEVIKLSPSLVKAYVEIANIYFELTQKDEAMFYYKKALEFQPDNIEALVGLGFVYNSLNKYSEAKELFKKAIDIRKDYPEAYYGLGLSYFYLGDYVNAKIYLYKARDLFYECGNKDIVENIDNILLKI
ncbi:MAG: tetratricopeptide repeat protein [Candidatus Omnitrophica bacterium]|nr:tetratricopeptide repeat protein [Candidatus Omnitrophota bacterium]